MVYKRDVCFSVITVCFNEEKTIGKTIESVLAQSCLDFEYIICDGGSTDQTVRIAESYKEAFAKKNIRYLVSSERDGGIYFGMNKGIQLAQGDYLHFLNAGDRYHDAAVLETVQKEMRDREGDIFYGNVFYVERGFAKLSKGNLASMNDGMSICHQSMFIKTALMKDRPYDTAYRVVADYDFTLAMKHAGKVFQYIDYPIADYRAGGVSTTQVEKIAKEYCEVKKKAGLPCDYNTERKIARRNMLMASIKGNMPKWLWEKYSISKGHIRMD